MNPNRLRKQIEYIDENIKVKKTAAVYVGAVLDFLCKEILDKAHRVCYDPKDTEPPMIQPSHLQEAFRGDIELNILLMDVIRGGLWHGK